MTEEFTMRGLAYNPGILPAEMIIRQRVKPMPSREELLEVQLKLSEAAERAWESSMMQACGEDGPKSVADKFAELEANCAALASDNEKAMEAMRQADAAVKLAHEKFSALAAENAMLKQRTQQLIDIISNTDNDYCMCGSAMKDHVHSGCGYPTGMFDYYYNQWLESDNKTPATDAFLAEVRAQCLNAFIQHHSAELDAHIKNGGEQFDEKSVRIRDIIVSARLFREQIRKGAAL
ncbi:DUF2737 family protein [Escherichia coli]|nr:DUF2737 family protein [Escherichia coli]EGO4953709.1 DUF2737 family protein [Escherichia coli]EJG6354587.1 DUF2737 family protein [Escherichia coli]EJV5980000.1 DUF2737 family protein [Escherichia coli]